MKKVCENCGNEFTPKNRGKRGELQKYCSVSCSLRMAKVTRIVTCVDCGAEVTHLGRGRRLRCDECKTRKESSTSAEWQRLHRTKKAGVGSGGAQWGADNHEFKGGKSAYKGAYRARCLKVHSAVCVICGKSAPVDVHHIDGDKSRCDADNLVPLCRSCHKRVHYAISKFVSRSAYIQAFDSVMAEVKSRNKAGTA